MKIRMLQQNSGPRPDGSPWPPRGEVIDVPEGEAEALIASRQAAPLAKPRAGASSARQREREHDQAVADTEVNQDAANEAHIHAAELRFAARQALAAADKAVADAEDAEADAEELQAKADKGAPKDAPRKQGEETERHRQEHGRAQT